MKRLLPILLLLLAPRAHAQALDIYGGYAALSCANSGGHFIPIIYFGHSLLCDPAGHLFFFKGVDVVDDNAGDDQFGKSGLDYAVAKFGNSGPTWANQTAGQLRSWGMNANSFYASASILPSATDPSYPGDHSIPNKMPLPYILRPGYYHSTNNNGGFCTSITASPVKDVWYGAAAWFRASYGFIPAFTVPDFDDSSYQPCLAAVLQTTSQNIYKLIHSTSSAYLFAIQIEDSDQTFGYNGSYDFATSPSGHNQPHISFVVATGSPVQTANDHIHPGGLTSGANYWVYKVSQKADTFRNLAGSTYGTIGALNAAWGTAYSSFGTSGTCFGAGMQAALPCEHTGAAANIGTGDGAQTLFPGTLATTVSKHSVAVLVGGAVACGDNLSGNLVSPSTGQTYTCTGAVNYATGAISPTISPAPAIGLAVTVEYIANGYGVPGSTGLLDDDGTLAAGNGAWGSCSNNTWPALSCNYATYGTMNPILAAFLKLFEYTLVHNWLSANRATLATYAPGVLQIPSASGTWSTVPSCDVVHGIATDADILQVGEATQLTQAMLDFVRSCAQRDLPIEAGEFRTANADSEFSYSNVAASHSGTTVTLTSPIATLFDSNNHFFDVINCLDPTYDVNRVRFSSCNSTTATYSISIAPSSPTTTGCTVYFDDSTGGGFASQASRGADFFSKVSVITSRCYTATGVCPFIGYDWWQLYSNYGERNNWGLLTLKGNTYGHGEAVAGPVACATPESIYPCGNEPGGPYGDVISSVIATNAAIDSAILALQPSPPSAGAPAAPFWLTSRASALPPQVSLFWTQSVSPAISGSNVYRGVSGGPFSLLASLSPAVTSFTDTSAFGGISYCYEVTALSDGGESAGSSQACSTTPVGVSAPFGLSVKIHRALPFLTWTQSATRMITGNKVYRATVSGGPYTLLNSFTSPGTSFSDATASRGQRYYYVVTAVAGSQESAYSNEAVTSVP